VNEGNPIKIGILSNTRNSAFNRAVFIAGDKSYEYYVVKKCRNFLIECEFRIIESSEGRLDLLHIVRYLQNYKYVETCVHRLYKLISCFYFVNSENHFELEYLPTLLFL